MIGFVATAVAEIVGCYLPYLWLRRGGEPVAGCTRRGKPISVRMAADFAPILGSGARLRGLWRRVRRHGDSLDVVHRRPEAGPLGRGGRRSRIAGDVHHRLRAEAGVSRNRYLVPGARKGPGSCARQDGNPHRGSYKRERGLFPNGYGADVILGKLPPTSTTPNIRWPRQSSMWRGEGLSISSPE